MQADPDRSESEERALHALAAWPRPPLSAARHAQIRAALHGALRQPNGARVFERWLALAACCGEPALLALCGGLVLVRLAALLLRYFGA